LESVGEVAWVNCNPKGALTVRLLVGRGNVVPDVAPLGVMAFAESPNVVEKV
jgi:hypothetical protein